MKHGLSDEPSTDQFVPRAAKAGNPAA